MKKKLKLLCALMICSATSMLADELAHFDPYSFNAWDYTRSGVTLTTEYISRDNVNLYKNGNDNYTLISPVLSKGNVSKIIVSFKGKSNRYNNSNYDAYRGSPTIELLDMSGNVVASCFHEFIDKVRAREFTVSLSLKDLEGNSFKVRFACWNADLNCALSVNEVVIDGLVEGDVDGDGSVTSGDITVLYNYLINSDDSSMVNGDVDSDGSITSADVTVVYNLLLGVG